MAGQPEPWRAGESLSEREIRIRQTLSSAKEHLARIELTWGPFRVAVLQAVELARQQDFSSTTESELHAWARRIVWGRDPYGRIVSWFLLFAALDAHPAFGDRKVGPVRSNDEEPSGPELHFEGTYLELLTGLLEEWIRSELDAPDLRDVDAAGTFGVPDRGPVDLRTVARTHAVIGRIHAAIARLVFRAAINDVHFAQARSDSADSDPGGDLLLVGHALVDRFFNQIMDQATEGGAGGLLEELEGIGIQAPLSEGRHVVGELFTPDAMGVGPGMINPYLTLLLAVIQADADRASGARWGGSEAPTGIGNSGTASELTRPIWWTRAIEDAVRALAAREAPASVGYLENLARQGNAANRFETLLTLGVEAQAQQLLDRFGREDDGLRANRSPWIC